VLIYFIDNGGVSCEQHPISVGLSVSQLLADKAWSDTLDTVFSEELLPLALPTSSFAFIRLAPVHLHSILDEIDAEISINFLASLRSHYLEYLIHLALDAVRDHSCRLL